MDALRTQPVARPESLHYRPSKHTLIHRVDPDETMTPTSGSPSPIFELRVYTIHPGKTEALHDRFRQHTLRLFKRHAIESLGYWMPTRPEDSRLHFLLRYPSLAARETSWKAFESDPEWISAKAASETHGRLVASAATPLLVMTDYSPEPILGDITGSGVFEFREYTTFPQRLVHLDARFRDHTRKLFERHGMRNWAYFHRLPDQPEASVRLEYFLHHRSQAAGEESFRAFRLDPDWIAARAASEQRGGGCLTLPDGVKSTYLVPTDYSPTW